MHIDQVQRRDLKRLFVDCLDAEVSLGFLLVPVAETVDVGVSTVHLSNGVANLEVAHLDLTSSSNIDKSFA